MGAVEGLLTLTLLAGQVAPAGKTTKRPLPRLCCCASGDYTRTHAVVVTLRAGQGCCCSIRPSRPCSIMFCSQAHECQGRTGRCPGLRVLLYLFFCCMGMCGVWGCVVCDVWECVVCDVWGCVVCDVWGCVVCDVWGCVMCGDVRSVFLLTGSGRGRYHGDQTRPCWTH